MDINGLIRELERRRAKQGTWKAVAQSLGVSDQYVQDVKTQRRQPGPTFLSALGYQRTVVYRKINS